MTPIPDDIWEQLPQSYPKEGRSIVKKLMNERLKTLNEAFHKNHPNYDESILFPDDDKPPTEEDIKFLERLKKSMEKKNQ